MKQYQAHLEGNQMRVTPLNPYDKNSKDWDEFEDWCVFDATHKKSYFTNDPGIKEGIYDESELEFGIQVFHPNDEWVDADKNCNWDGYDTRPAVKLKLVSQPVNKDQQKLIIQEVMKEDEESGLYEPVNEGEGEKEQYMCRECDEWAAIDYNSLCEDCEDKRILEAAKIITSKPVLTEAFADNGEHSHWRLIDPDTGDLLWTEDPKEDAILYTVFKPQTEEKPEERIVEILGVYNAWPLKDVLAKLVEVTEYLLDVKNYDRTGWEEVSGCAKRGREYLYLLNNFNHACLMHPIKQEDKQESEAVFQLLEELWWYVRLKNKDAANGNFEADSLFGKVNSTIDNSYSNTK